VVLGNSAAADQRKPNAAVSDEGFSDEHAGSVHDGREDSRAPPCTALHVRRRNDATVWRDQSATVIM
jgi:hypothetical protein